MAKIILLANGIPGIEVAKIVKESGDEVVRLYYHGDDDYCQYISDILKLNPSAAFTWDDFRSPDHINPLLKEPADFLISVYWPYLLREDELYISTDSINFHPALLPINRGWDPHVHSLLDGSPAGVTLHRIAIGADTGDIWLQKEVEVCNTDTASDIYFRLQEHIIDLFKNNWGLIRNKELVPFPQNESIAVYHKKSELEKLDHLDLDKKTTFREAINLLRSRTFNNKGYAYFMDHDGSKIRVSITLRRE